MNLGNFFLQSFRLVLLPVAILYGLVVRCRNIMYDKRWLISTSFNFPIICVGNLSVGGTGKSPMIEFLTKRLGTKYKLAILSRGYKRKTKGYLLANSKSTALDIGDEPMQFYQKFPHIPIAVGEERITAIPQLLQDVSDIQLLLLDDAYQHRAIHPGFSILLTDYSDLFTRDFYLPTGNLRDDKSSYKRADIIIVTKCPNDLPKNEKDSISDEINCVSGQSLFFSTITYGKPYHFIQKEKIRSLDKETDVLLVSGIANITPIKDLLAEQTHGYDQLNYGDHHIFTIDDIRDIKNHFSKINNPNAIILTTEKDAVRLVKFTENISELPIYVLPIEHTILFNEENILMEKINHFIQSFRFN
ncbi:MAG: tetraacyldisaccharide 4'-kinase [Bacteroidota bacterium]|jgi:tetraacyldisaccharide 4'-kinase